VRLSPIRIEFVRPDAVTSAIVDRIWTLAQESLDVSRDWIAEHARGCDHLILYRHARTGAVVGATGLSVIDLDHAGVGVRVLYTSAVLIEGAWRSRNLIQQAGVASVLRFGFGPRRLYWLSECDNFRAYLVAARNFIDVWPRHGRAVPAFEGTLIARLCREMFGDAWDGTSGICAAIPNRVLLGEYSAIPPQVLADDVDAAYFARRNPGYRAGDGLPVLVRLDARNMASMLRCTARVTLRRWRDRRAPTRDHAASREVPSVRPPRFRGGAGATSVARVPPPADLRGLATNGPRAEVPSATAFAARAPDPAARFGSAGDDS
jgi:hypothetical protein